MNLPHHAIFILMVIGLYSGNAFSEAKYYPRAGTSMTVYYLEEGDSLDSCMSINKIDQFQRGKIFRKLESNIYGITNIFGMMAEKSIDRSTNDVYGTLRLEIRIHANGKIESMKKKFWDIHNEMLFDRIVKIISRNNFKSAKLGNCVKLILEINFVKDIELVN